MVSEGQIAIEGPLLRHDGRVRYGFLVANASGKIAEIGDGPLPQTYESAKRIIKSAPDQICVPGYVDVQINGGFGEEVKSNATAVQKLKTHLPQFGITSFVPTVTSLPLDAYPEVLSNIRRYAMGPGTDVLGVHLEGPFLNPTMRGGHPEEYLSAPAAIRGKEFATDPLIRMVTLAPELDGALALIELLARRGIVVGVGHSTAGEKTLVDAKARGLRWGTHVFNAMEPMKGREVGLAGFLLSESGFTTGLIADGIHVHPRMVALAYRMKGLESLILMTDSSAVTGLPAGTYQFRNRKITTNGESARLPDGTLVGSVLTLDRAVRNMVQFTACTLIDAVSMASRGPARLLGLEKRKGELTVGADADVVILDKDLSVLVTVIGGRVEYERLAGSSEQTAN